jgi:hypothetical protein
MKILFDNLAELATISAPGESGNYPASNLANIFLRKRYQALTGSDTITFTFTSDQVIDSFFYGYNNKRLGDAAVYAMTTTFRDSLGASLGVQTIAACANFGAIYFTTISAVRTVEVAISWAGAGAAYLGGIGFGQAYTMPETNLLADWGDAVEDNSTVDTTEAGAVIRDYAEPLTLRPVNFAYVERDDYLVIKNYLATTGKGKPLWVDPFDEDHTFMLPLYAQIVDGMQNATKDPERQYWSFSLVLKEAR